MVDSEDHKREALLKDNSTLADVRLARILKDICLEGWSSDPSRAVSSAQAIKLLYNQFPNPEIGALADWCIGLEFLINGEMESAIKRLDLAQARFVALDKARFAASTQVSKLIALAMLGRYEEAIGCGLRAGEVFKTEGDDLALGKVEHNIGNIYFRRDLYSEAEKYQRSARIRFQSVGDVVQLAKIENSLALTLSQQHRTKDAELLYEQALNRAEAVGLKSTQAEIESSIGTLALYQGYYDRALDFLERSRRKYEELNMPHILAMTEQEIADAYLELNLVPEAIEIYKRVEGRFANLGMHAEEARALAYHGRAEIALGKFEQAQSLLSSARELYLREGNEVGASLVELSEAQLFYARGDFISAQAAAKQVEMVLSSAANPRRVVFARWLQGEAARSDQRLPEGRFLLESALKLADELSQPDIHARCLTSLGLIAVMGGDNMLAEQQFKSAVETIEQLRAPLPGEEFRSAFFSDKLVPYIELARLMLTNEQSRIEEAFLYVERARSRTLVDALHTAADSRLDGKDSFDVGLVQRLEEKRHELTYFYNQLNLSHHEKVSRSTEQITTLQNEIRQREAAIAEISRQLRHSKNQRGSTGEDLDLVQLQRSLGQEKVLVEFFNLDDELAAFVVTDTRIDVIRELGSVSEVGDQVATFRFQIDSLRFGSSAIRKHLSTLTTRVQQHLQKLYDRLLAPLLHLIDQRDLVIVPTGRLHYLPFHALHDGIGYVIETRAISYAPSAAVLQQCLARGTGEVATALLMGAADEAAPQIQNEIEYLGKMFSNAELYAEELATLGVLKSRAVHKDLLHLACHAHFRADNPQFSALKLADGWLTVSDISTLKLRSGLVTLSACETGVSAVAPGEELIGLARGFFLAGAATVVLSLWSIDDEATLELMRVFYHELIRSKAPAKALQTAEISLLRTHPHPFFWSPFVVVGRW